MSALVAAILGAGGGLGLFLFLLGLAGRRVLPSNIGTRIVDRVAGLPTGRLATAVAAAFVMLALTGWPVAATLAVVAVLTGPRLFGGRTDREASVARTEAIASWTEMIRANIAAGAGLEEAIVSTAKGTPSDRTPLAPPAIRREVVTLAQRLERESLAAALAAFGDEVAHPCADLVVVSLTIAARMEASDLTGLLSRLADAIRDDARMRIRVEVGRTKLRTACKIIVGVSTVFATFVAVFSRDYLAAYDSAGGQLMLVVVAAIFALGGWLMVRMAELEMPERFSARATTQGTRP